jgi:AraC-like DNA-binding protein
MVFWLDNIYRCNTKIEALNRVGYLPGKDRVIKRKFPHLAFFCKLSDDNGFIEDESGRHLVPFPFCILAMPDDIKTYGPFVSWDEFFFVFPAESIDQLFNGVPPELPKHNMLYLDDFPIIRRYIDLMLEVLKKPLTPQTCSQLDMLAWGILAASFWRHTSLESNKQGEKLFEVETYINHNYHRNIDINEIALQFGMSYSTLKRLWDQKYSIPPHKMVQNLRNHEARELLRNNKLSVAKIAELTGYNDARYFSRAFRSMNGVSPSEYRNNQKNLPDDKP